MKAELINNHSGYKAFQKVKSDIYAGNPCYKGTDASVEKLLLNSKSAFHKHSVIKKFVVSDGKDKVARFALIHDHRLANYIQVSFFEAREGLGNLFDIIKEEIHRHFPECRKVVVGINGHLNYGAGILLNHFDEAPVFGFAYNPPYYADYFSELKTRKMVTFRFDMKAYIAWARNYFTPRELDGLEVRFMNKKEIRKESYHYTELNNLAFQTHPYWADRDEAEDYELFKPFRFLLDNENLIFAEVHGKPVGFCLWYPDFNQLTSNQKNLGLMDLIRFRCGKSIDTFRFTEIGILPKYQKSPVILAIMGKMLPALIKQDFKYCEGGFIFEENCASMAFVKRILERCSNEVPQTYREFATFETTL